MNGIKDAFLGDTPYSAYVPPFQSHSTTSREAARLVAPRVTGLQQRVLDYFKANPEGATDEMLIDAFGGSRVASTIRPRRIELVQQGKLKDSGRYALTHAGRKATVWVIA